MVRILLSVLTVLVLEGYVFDQERETYVFSDTNGNIGIGSAQPTAKLDVNGNTELDDLNVSGVSTFQDDVRFPSAGASGLGNIRYDKSVGELKFSGVGADKIKSTYTYGGDSFSVYQNLANQSLIQSNTATDLYIAFDGSTYITDQNGSNQSAVFNGTGAVELYHNNDKKLETTGYGVTVTGQLNVYNSSTTGVSTQFKGQSGPTDYISFERSGTFNTFGIRSNAISLNTDGDFGVSNKADDESYITVSGSTGQVSLYHGKSPSDVKFSTMSYGINVNGRVETDRLNVSGVSTFTGAIYWCKW